MYQLNASRVLYQISKYAPVAVLQLDVTVFDGPLSRAQINGHLERIGGYSNLLAPTGKSSAVEIYCDLVLGLQRSVGQVVQYCRLEAMEDANEYRVFTEYEEETTALYAAEVATELLNTILDVEDGSQLHTILNEFTAYARPRLLDSNTRFLIRAARRLGIPVLQPVLPTSLYASAAEVSNHEFRLGWGVHQRLLNGAICTKLVSMATLSQVSDRAKLYPGLVNAGLPLPGQDLEFLRRNQARRAQRSAQRIGYPVVVRPRAIRLFQYRFAEDYMLGPLHNEKQVALAARHLVDNCGLDVWVESYVAGDLYRLLVLNGAVLSAVRCQPPMITGDGVTDISELTGQLDDEDVLFRLELADYGMHSVLPSGVQLALRGSGSAVNGGSCEDVTSQLPARFRKLAVRVAECSGLGILAGVDLVIGELAGDAQTPNCMISNVVADPDLSMFERLSEQPERIGDGYMTALFPAGEPSRVPIVSITGSNGKTTTCRMVRRILQKAGLKTGLACTDGVYLDDEWLNQDDASGVSGAVVLFTTAELEVAVLETARGGLANTGIAYDRCDVGACTNVAAEHLGDEGIETMDEMAAHKRQVIERTVGTAVLNAEDPRCLAMREHTAASEVILVALSTANTVIKRHCEAGGKAIALADGKVVMLSADDRVTPIINVNNIPAAFRGAADYNVMNAMFAIAICLSLGIEQKIIAAALKAFRMDVENTPGRLNEISGFPFKVIVDAAHNDHGLKALVGLIDQIPVQGKKIINFGISGYIPDEAIQAFAKQAAGHFDSYIVRNNTTDRQIILRRRLFEETPGILNQELIRMGVSEDKIIVEPDYMASLDTSLKCARKGDLLLVTVKAATDDKFKVVRRLEAAAKKWALEQ